MSRFVSSWLGCLIWLWTQRNNSVVQSFQISPGRGLSDMLQRPLSQPALHSNYFHTTQIPIDYLRIVVLHSKNDGGASADDANDSSSPLSSRHPDDSKLTDQNQQKEGHPILIGVTQTKVSGILCIAALLSQGAYDRGGRDISALDGILGFLGFLLS